MSNYLSENGRTSVRLASAFGLALSILLAGCDNDNNNKNKEPELVDRAYYILPPGNYGGLPATENSLDQLPLYDGLTPLRGDISDEDIENHFLPENFEPVGETTEEPTGRPGLTINYDDYGIPHVTGQTREDLAFGAGWVTARDRSILVNLGRWTARLAVADVPGIDAFGALLAGQSFVPSAATEQLVTDQVNLIIETYGDEGRQIIADAQAYADGYNAYRDTQGSNPVPVTVNDVVAVTAFIGSIFGAGGGAEAVNAEFLSQLVYGLGDGQAQLAWEDIMLFDDPEAPTTLDTRFEYGPLTGGDVTGSVVIDAGSIISLDPREMEFPAPDTGVQQAGIVSAAAAPPRREASNWLIVNAPQSVNDTHLAVMGPQLGYYYPEIVQQIHFSGAGIEAQGVAVPGMAMYILIGRTENYAWSLTSASHDVQDVYAEILCNPDGSDPTRESLYYLYDGECRPFEIFDAGVLSGTPIRYPLSVHGPMIGTATSEGRPVALTRKRSTFGRDGLNLAALKDLTEGDGSTPEKFYDAANKFGFTFNWGYVSRTNVAYFSSGLLPVRPAGLDRRLPTLGTGGYEWQGFLSRDQHPHAADGPAGRLLNWNNQSAPGFMHGDDNPYGSIHRVELFDQFPDQVDLADVVSVMNRSATEDVRSPAWPVVSEVLHGSEAPSALAAQVVNLLDAWVDEDAPRLDADDDGFYDQAGPTIIDALWDPLAKAVMRPVFGDLTEALDDFLNLGGNPSESDGNNGSSLMDKDLRTLLGKPVKGPFNLHYCGGGVLEACRDSLWQVIEEVSQTLAAEYGGSPDTWLKQAVRAGFAPGLIPNTFRATNRSTFQQVLEFAPAAAD